MGLDTRSPLQIYSGHSSPRLGFKQCENSEGNYAEIGIAYKQVCIYTYIYINRASPVCYGANSSLFQKRYRKTFFFPIRLPDVHVGHISSVYQAQQSPIFLKQAFSKKMH